MPSDPLPLDPIAEAHRLWTAHGWGEVADGMAAVTSVMRVQQIMLARVEAVLKPLGLTFARYELLMLLSFSRAGSLPMATISSRLQVHPASVTNLVDRLQGASYVVREPHPRDRRATLVRLTDAGRTLAAEATGRLNAEVFAAPGASAGDVAELNAILSRFRRDAGDFADAGGAPWASE